MDSFLSHPEFVKQLSKYLSVSERTIYDWVGDEFKTIENKRDLLIFKLSLLGWTQEEIADVFRLGRQTIADIISNAGIGNTNKTTNKERYPEICRPFSEKTVIKGENCGYIIINTAHIIEFI